MTDRVKRGLLFACLALKFLFVVVRYLYADLTERVYLFNLISSIEECPDFDAPRDWTGIAFRSGPTILVRFVTTDTTK